MPREGLVASLLVFSFYVSATLTDVTATTTTLATTTKTAIPASSSTTMTVVTPGRRTTQTVSVACSLSLVMSAASARELVQGFQGPKAQKVKDALAESLALYLEGISRQDIKILNIALSLQRRLGEMRRLVDAKAKVDYRIRIPSGSSSQDVAAKVIALPGSAFVSTANGKLQAAGVWSVDPAPSQAATTGSSGEQPLVATTDTSVSPVVAAVSLSGFLIFGAFAAVICKLCCRAHSDAYSRRRAYQTEEGTEIPKDDCLQEEGQKEELPTEEVDDASAPLPMLSEEVEPTAYTLSPTHDASLMKVLPPLRPVTEVLSPLPSRSIPSQISVDEIEVWVCDIDNDPFGDDCPRETRQATVCDIENDEAEDWVCDIDKDPFEDDCPQESRQATVCDLENDPWDSI